MSDATLVGRTRELQMIRQAVLGASSGAGSALILMGPAGIGKSRLARAAQRFAEEEGIRVDTGRCVPGGAALRPFTEVALGLFDTSAADKVAMFDAVLRRLLPAGTSPGSDVTPDSVLVVGEAVRRALRVAAAGDGLLLVLEDLHWADTETLAAVEYILDHRDPGLSCVLTLRPDATEASGVVHRVAQRAAEIVEVTALTDDEAGAVACETLGVSELDGAFAEELQAAAGGVPFFIEEVVRAARAVGAIRVAEGRATVAGTLEGIVPDSVSGMVATRLDALGGAAPAVLQAAALLGRDFPVHPLPPVVDLTDDATLEALRAATVVGLVRDSGHGWFQFHHALTRDAILGGLIGPERADLAGRLLAVVGDTVDVAVRATLAEEAGDAPRAVALRCELARTALRQGALVAAETEARSARADAGDDPSLRADAAELMLEVAATAGMTEEATAAGAEAIALLTRLGAAGGRLAATRARLARADMLAGRLDAAAGQLERARSDADGDAGAIRDADVLSARLALLRGDADTARLFAEGFRATGQAQVDPDLMCETLEILGQCDRLADFDEAARTFATMLDTAVVHDRPYWRLRALTHLGAVDLHLTGSTDRLEEARQLAAGLGAVAIAAEVDIQTVFLVGMLFRLEEASAAARRAAEICERYDLAVVLPLVRAQQAAVAAWQGRSEDMESFIEAAQRSAPEDDPTVASIVWGDARAMLALFQEDRAAALRNLERAVAYPAGYETAAAPSRGFWALLRTIEGIDGSGARATVRAVGAHDAWWNVALLRYAEAVDAARSGDHAAATSAVAEADTLLRSYTGAEWVIHLARRHVGEVALADGWGEAATWLAQAADFWEPHHPRVASRCRSLLRRAGLAVPRRSRTGPPVPAMLRAMGVTSREAEVLQLVAGGKSNREIAERLYLSHRTVEKHVESLLRKTSAGGRVQLAVLAQTSMREITDSG